MKIIIVVNKNEQNIEMKLVVNTFLWIYVEICDINTIVEVYIYIKYSQRSA